MVFLPEKMRIKSAKAVKDSESEDEGMEEGGGVAIDLEEDEEEAEQSSTRVAEGRGKKRKIATVKEEEEEAEETIRPMPKRRRKIAAPKRKHRSRQIEAASEDEQGASPNETEGGSRSRASRRQSTMTQLVEGRRPLSDTEEPEFKPVKRSPRLSWSGRGKKGSDKQQRTLTQMIPGMRPAEIMSDEDIEEVLSDIEADEKGSQAYGDAVTQRLAQQGLHQAEGDGSDDAVVVQSVEDFADVDDEDSYQPTQYIDAPITRTSRAPRLTNTGNRAGQPAYASPTTTRKAPKPRFSLLSTPEKRCIREIPSSQSPADSPLSTQVSPLKANRLPLKECSGNAIQGPDTPSRRKKVTFKEPLRERNPPPILRRFESTIQDSEDEYEEIVEEDTPSSGQRIGADTQAMLKQIDQVCDDAEEDGAWPHRDSSEELGEQTATRGRNEASQVVGEQQEQSGVMRQENILHKQSPYRAAHVIVKEESLQDIEMLDLTTPEPQLLPEEQSTAEHEPTSDGVELPAPAEELHSTPPLIESYPQETFPSTPMVIRDDSSDEEDEPHSTPPSRGRQSLPQPTSPSSIIPPSADLNDGPIQVPRSPSAQRVTQQSHSSKAEQQLQTEWLSYSQYHITQPPQSSSMNVGPDAFSYKATPLPPRSAAALATQPSGQYLSQATTVDEVTPKKKSRHGSISANVTPHRIASSQPVISPSKPPPLFIPSSFPSPAKAVMEGWSSPVYGRTQDLRSSQFGASLEDFSIPLPPPVEDD